MEPEIAAVVFASSGPADHRRQVIDTFSWHVLCLIALPELPAGLLLLLSFPIPRHLPVRDPGL